MVERPVTRLLTQLNGCKLEGMVTRFLAACLLSLSLMQPLTGCAALSWIDPLQQQAAYSALDAASRAMEALDAVAVDYLNGLVDPTDGQLKRAEDGILALKLARIHLVEARRLAEESKLRDSAAEIVMATDELYRVTDWLVEEGLPVGGLIDLIDLARALAEQGAA